MWFDSAFRYQILYNQYMGKIIHGMTPEEERKFIEERRKSAFLTASQSPSRWYSVADRHKRAADILYEIAHAADERETERRVEEFKRTSAKMKKLGLKSYSESKTLEGVEISDFLDTELLSEYLLLVGYALECILKGYLLTTQPELIENDEKLVKNVTTHNLLQLCSDCNIKLSKTEKQVLDWITLNVEWRKYPVPKDRKNMPSPVEPSQKSLGIPPFHDRKLKLSIDQIYYRGCILLAEYKNSDDV